MQHHIDRIFRRVVLENRKNYIIQNTMQEMQIPLTGVYTYQIYY